MSIHEHLPPQARKELKKVRWTGPELAKVARRDGQRFDCAAWLQQEPTAAHPSSPPWLTPVPSSIRLSSVPFWPAVAGAHGLTLGSKPSTWTPGTASPEAQASILSVGRKDPHSWNWEDICARLRAGQLWRLEETKSFDPFYACRRLTLVVSLPVSS